MGQLVLATPPFITQKCIAPYEIPGTCNIHVPTTYRYCCNTDFCNNVTAVQKFLGITQAPALSTNTHSSNTSRHHSNPTTTPSIPSDISSIVISVTAVCMFLLALVLAAVTVPLVLRYCRYTGSRGSHDYRKALHLHEELSSEDSTYGSGSGSGAGMAQLSQVTIARQVRN